MTYRSGPLKVMALFLATVALAEPAGAVEVTARVFRPNPTEYVFDFPRPNVISVIDEMARIKPVLGRFLITGPEWDSTRSTASYKATPLFGKANAHEVYFLRGAPLGYFAVYTITVGQVNGSQCLVGVRAMNAAVIVPGRKFNWHTLRFDQGKRVEVASTTIEEYELLREIGWRLGQAGMPALSVPAAKH